MDLAGTTKLVLSDYGAGARIGGASVTRFEAETRSLSLESLAPTFNLKIKGLLTLNRLKNDVSCETDEFYSRQYSRIAEPIPKPARQLKQEASPSRADFVGGRGWLRSGSSPSGCGGCDLNAGSGLAKKGCPHA